MMRLSGEHSAVRVVADQHGCPTSAADLARAVVATCVAIQSGKGHFGTYHVTNSGATSWYNFATAIFESLALRGKKVPGQIIPITTAEYSTKALRPPNSVLDCSRLAKSFGIIMRPWRTALEECLDELVVQGDKTGVG
jgi:dTDP-4-dehydrorhamnose reductase